jgi:hypothetical protein
MGHYLFDLYLTNLANIVFRMSSEREPISNPTPPAATCRTDNLVPHQTLPTLRV